MAAARAAARAPGGARRGGSACLRPAPSSVTDGRRLWRGATELGSGGAAAWTRSSAEPASLGAAPPAPEHRAVTREGGALRPGSHSAWGTGCAQLAGWSELGGMGEKDPFLTGPLKRSQNPALLAGVEAGSFCGSWRR